MKKDKPGIDFVLIWVDEKDIEWQKSKAKYDCSEHFNNVRYRDWECLKYWFRGVEKFAPWVRKIHFVTCGHLPEWLNMDHPKLCHVKHSDYIPGEYLPTFSSHPIELNLHRIEGLAEHFVYFNDDTFLLSKVRPDDFFRGGLPCDCAVLNPQIAVRHGIGSIVSNDLGIISEYFDFSKQFYRNPGKWFNYKYGRYLLRNLLLFPWRRYIGFLEPHLPSSYLKSVFYDVWEKEGEFLSEVCTHKFRNPSDVNQWLMRYWQLASGQFYPRSPRIGKMLPVININETERIIRKQKYKLFCVNDTEQITDIGPYKQVLIDAFETILPVKSGFEL